MADSTDPADSERDFEALARHSGVIEVDESTRPTLGDYVRLFAGDAIVSLGAISLFLLGVVLVVQQLSTVHGGTSGYLKNGAGVLIWLLAGASGFIFLGRFIRPTGRLPVVARLVSGIAGFFLIAPGVINLIFWATAP